MALCLVLLSSSYSNAQVDSTTGNLINYGTAPTDTTSTWNNGVYVNTLCFQYGQPGNCGPNPSVRPGGNINFSYGTTDLNQIVNINKALAAGGTGVQLSGFNFSFTAKNGNGWDDARQDYLAAYVKFYNAAGGLAANYDYSNQTNQRYNWTNFNFNETFANPIAASNYSNAQVGFVGRDNNFWAGNYGPEIYNVGFSLKYRVDPCALNPAYSPNCAGFSTVSTSGNLVPNPGGYAVYGDSINQSYAINVALASAGSAAQVHGFQWGYVANANGPYCASWFLVCFDNRDPSVTTNVNITNSSGASLYSVTREYRNSYNTTEYSYLFPQSQTMSTLGSFNFTASTNDAAYVGSMWSRALYTADPCAVNPLSSPTCSGYGAAYAKLIASSSTTSSTTTAYIGVTSPTTSSLVETTPTGMIDQTSPQPQQSQQTQQQSSPPPQDTTQQTAVAQMDPSQPSPTQAGPAPTNPQPAGGPAQTTASSSSQQSGPGAGPGAGPSAGPSKLAMSVLKSAQEKDKATQASAVQNAAKTLEAATQSSQASSNLAISMNQDMSANSAVAAANFASQTTQTSQQTAMSQTSQQQQTVQTSTQTQQSSRLVQQTQQIQQETQQAQVQGSSSVVKLLTPQQQETQQAQAQNSNNVQYQPPQQQETQQAQAQSSSSVVRLLPPQQQEQQQSQNQMTASASQMPQNTYTAPQQQPQDTQSTQVTMLKPPTPPVTEVQQSASSGTGLTVSRNLFAYNPLMSSSSSSMPTIQQSPQMYQPRLDSRQSEIDIPQMPIASFGGAGRAGNPLSEIMTQQRFEMMQNNIAAPTSSVNKNVQPNEIAGKVDIASMATIPVGFSAYSIVLKDAAFYEPKEVYKNQKTVDNERVLRGLTRGSDSLHQQMVDQQYKVGN